MRRFSIISALALAIGLLCLAPTPSAYAAEYTRPCVAAPSRFPRAPMPTPG